MISRPPVVPSEYGPDTSHSSSGSPQLRLVFHKTVPPCPRPLHDDAILVRRMILPSSQKFPAARRHALYYRKIFRARRHVYWIAPIPASHAVSRHIMQALYYTGGFYQNCAIVRRRKQPDKNKRTILGVTIIRTSNVQSPSLPRLHTCHLSPTNE